MASIKKIKTKNRYGKLVLLMPILLILLISSCSTDNSKTKTGGLTIFETFTFELPPNFNNHKIDTVFVQYSYKPKHTFNSENESIVFYQFETCSIIEMLVRAAASYYNSTFNLNNDITIRLLSLHKICISCSNNFHADSTDYQLTSFFIINQKLLLYEYSTTNSKEKIDTLTGIKILNSIHPLGND